MINLRALLENVKNEIAASKVYDESGSFRCTMGLAELIVEGLEQAIANASDRYFEVTYKIDGETVTEYVAAKDAIEASVKIAGDAAQVENLYIEEITKREYMFGTETDQ